MIIRPKQACFQEHGGVCGLQVRFRPEASTRAICTTPCHTHIVRQHVVHVNTFCEHAALCKNLGGKYYDRSWNILYAAKRNCGKAVFEEMGLRLWAGRPTISRRNSEGAYRPPNTPCFLTYVWYADGRFCVSYEAQMKTASDA